MTHVPSKRLPRSGPVLAAVLGLLAALGLGTVGEAKAAAPASSAAAPAADRWSERAHGFASLAGGTTGGAGGKVVTVTAQPWRTRPSRR